MTPSAHPSPGRATFFLVLVTLFWGISFPLVRAWQDAARECPGGTLLASLTLIAVRFVMAFGLLAVAQPKLFSSATGREYFWGGLLGVLFLVGFIFQVCGMAQISPAMSAFLTALGSAWVPLFGWLLFRSPISLLTLLGLTVGIAGTVVLSLGEKGGWTLQGGETLTVVASILFALQIIALDRAGRTMRPVQLSAGFFLINAGVAVAVTLVVAAWGPGLAAWGEWSYAMLAGTASIQCGEQVIAFPLAAAVALLAIFPTVLAFHWMNTYQPYVPANRAALLYLLEPVFAGAFSLLVGMDAFTASLGVGGALILAGNLVVELSRRPHGPVPVPTVIDQG